MKSLRTVASHVGLVMFGLLLGFIPAEIVARRFYTAPWYEKLVTAQAAARFGAVHRNRFNLRGHDYAAVKPTRTIRIVLLGDSFTFGSGVPNDEAIFPALLERTLDAEAAADHEHVEILNAGSPGALTDSWVAELAEIKNSFAPDIIVAVFFLRDGTRTGAMSSFFGPIREQIVGRNHRSFLYRHFYVYRWLRDEMDRAQIGRIYARTLLDAYGGTAQQTEEWRAAQANLRRIKVMADSMGADMGLVIFPILAELNQPYPFQSICNAIGAFGSRLGVPTHQLLPAYLGRDATSLWVSPLNQHPNEQGHAIAASSLLPFVRRLISRRHSRS